MKIFIASVLLFSFSALAEKSYSTNDGVNAPGNFESKSTEASGTGTGEEKRSMNTKYYKKTTIKTSGEADSNTSTGTRDNGDKKPSVDSEKSVE